MTCRFYEYGIFVLKKNISHLKEWLLVNKPNSKQIYSLESPYAQSTSPWLMVEVITRSFVYHSPH